MDKPKEPTCGIDAVPNKIVGEGASWDIGVYAAMTDE
jgi:hypothetical protein